MSFDISVSKRLGDTRIALDLTAGGGVTILFGPSGAGKTSVLNMVAGLLRPDAGTIRVGGETLFDAAAGIDVAALVVNRRSPAGCGGLLAERRRQEQAHLDTLRAALPAIPCQELPLLAGDVVGQAALADFAALLGQDG